MIVVFGSINLDLIVRVMRLPRAGETVAGDHFSAQPGGKGANQALAAHRAGVKTALVGAVGNDAFSAPALAALAKAGVDVSLVRRVSTATGVAMVQVGAGGENSITVVAGANGQASGADVPDSWLNPATIVVLQFETPLATVIEFAARAHAKGARVLLNAAPAHAFSESLLESVDVLVVNEIEADALAAHFGLPGLPEAFVAAVHRRFGITAIMTLGAQGALAAADGQRMRVPAPTVQVRDTTGAGDAFTGALAAALDRRSPWRQALAEGVAAGSLACIGEGAQASLPTAAAIRRFSAGVLPLVVTSPID